MTPDAVLKLAEDAVNASLTNSPTSQLREVGKVLIEMADRLEGVAPREALKIIEAARVAARTK